MREKEEKAGGVLRTIDFLGGGNRGYHCLFYVNEERVIYKMQKVGE